MYVDVSLFKSPNPPHQTTSLVEEGQINETINFNIVNLGLINAKLTTINYI